jgi:hypothetical protein
MIIVLPPLDVGSCAQVLWKVIEPGHLVEIFDTVPAWKVI